MTTKPSTLKQLEMTSLTEEFTAPISDSDASTLDEGFFCVVPREVIIPEEFVGPLDENEGLKL